MHESSTVMQYIIWQQLLTDYVQPYQGLKVSNKILLKGKTPRRPRRNDTQKIGFTVTVRNNKVASTAKYELYYNPSETLSEGDILPFLLRSF